MHGQCWDTAGALMLGWAGVPGPQLARPMPLDPARICLDLPLPPPGLMPWLSVGHAVPKTWEGLCPTASIHSFMVETGLERQQEPCQVWVYSTPCWLVCRALQPPACLLPWLPSCVGAEKRQVPWGLFLGRNICLETLTQFSPSHAGLQGLPLVWLTTR